MTLFRSYLTSSAGPVERWLTLSATDPIRNIPSLIHITDGKTHEVNVMDDLMLEAGAFYLMDGGYLDFKRLFVIHEAQAFFVARAKSNS